LTEGITGRNFPLIPEMNTRGPGCGRGFLLRFLRLMRCLLATLLLTLFIALPAASGQGSDAGSTLVAAGAAEAHIQPGDQVTVRIFREPELSGDFMVTEAGELVLPRLGRIPVSGTSVVSLQDSLVSAYAEFLRNPAVAVTVLRRVGIHGEVRRPDLYMLDLTVTLREAIARAGGISEAGNPRDIVIIRGDEEIRIGEGEEARFLTADLRSGDQVVIGRRSWFALNPAVAVSTATGLISFVIGIVLLVR
jgi:protein involved in polysaccharide export with SLBB domain